VDVLLRGRVQLSRGAASRGITSPTLRQKFRFNRTTRLSFNANGLIPPLGTFPVLEISRCGTAVVCTLFW
jgi:hypothetical protein